MFLTQLLTLNYLLSLNDHDARNFTYLMWQLNTEFSNTPFWETRGAIRKLTLEFL